MTAKKATKTDAKANKPRVTLWLAWMTAKGDQLFVRPQSYIKHAHQLEAVDVLPGTPLFGMNRIGTRPTNALPRMGGILNHVALAETAEEAVEYLLNRQAARHTDLLTDLAMVEQGLKTLTTQWLWCGTVKLEDQPAFKQGSACAAEFHDYGLNQLRRCIRPKGHTGTHGAD